MRKNLILYIVLLLIGAVGILNSQVGSNGGQIISIGTTGIVGNASVTAENNIDCEALFTAQERIRCRMQTNVRSSVYEACRNLGDRYAKEECNNLHSNANKCYESSENRSECLMNASGFVNKNLREQAMMNQYIANKYVVALLSGLEIQINLQYSRGRINAEKASTILAKIVDMKQALFKSRSSAEIKTMFAGIKEEIKNR